MYPHSIVGLPLLIGIFVRSFIWVILVKFVKVSFEPFANLIHKLDYTALMFEILQLEKELWFDLHPKMASPLDILTFLIYYVNFLYVLFFSLCH